MHMNKNDVIHIYNQWKVLIEMQTANENIPYSGFFGCTSFHFHTNFSFFLEKWTFQLSSMSLPFCLHTKNFNVRGPMIYYLYSAPGASHQWLSTWNSVCGCVFWNWAYKLNSLILSDTSRLARGILCDGKNSNAWCIIRLSYSTTYFCRSRRTQYGIQQSISI